MKYCLTTVAGFSTTSNERMDNVDYSLTRPTRPLGLAGVPHMHL